MIRTIVIAAAGQGTRMKHLSEDKPKHLVRVAGKPFLHYVLHAIHAAGFERIIVVVGYHAEKMEAFLADQPYDITVVNQLEKMGDKHGTASVVEAVEDVVGQEPFVLVNGDTLYTPDVFDLLRNDDGMTHMVGIHHPDPTHYGVIDADMNGQLRKIVEKPKEPVSNYINLGVYSFQPTIFSIVRQVLISPRGEFEIIDALNMLADQGKVHVERSSVDWVDLGTPEDIPRVEEFLFRHNYL